ncbi:excinuclease ABC subunit UvrC [Desertibaculum subflavum]|uniref:excinuclease ABC subunit UvrC n=1 Tax=Desertibaculum subflavum TaxID=2268458 RepID=UPI000E6688C2
MPEPAASAEPPALQGAELIRAEAARLPNAPGVYRMLDAEGQLLYVGKAKSLKKRVASYAKVLGLQPRIARMVRETSALEIAVTASEVEALLLEANLIKRLKPRYNVSFRDDKSFPYILIAGDHDWPRITKYRGPRDRKGEYFGPFASAGAVNRTLVALQRAFPLRSCSDGEFAVRTRPCLQYQIKRCSAPCVGRVTHEAYGAVVDEVRAFLHGDSERVHGGLTAKMQAAAEALDYETAAVMRDRIKALAHIRARQDINVEGIPEADVIAAYAQGGQVCVQVFFFRGGQNLGNRAYFPTQARDVALSEVLGAFIGQFYEARPAPAEVLISEEIESVDLVGEALAVGAGHKVRVHAPQRGPRRVLVDHALANAREALERRLAENATQRKVLDGVAEVFGLEAPPERIEVYDNSHVQGSAPIGAMIVAGPEGFVKAAYRKFNIRDTSIAPGDDYAMMREVLTRRFARLLKEEEEGEPVWPDLVLIDGGPGQLKVAEEVIAELAIEGVALASIAKGPDRNAGREHFYLPGRQPFMLEPRHPVLYFMQRLRDEAHRFAIGTHRARRAKSITRSVLDEIAGIGAKRKRALLLHFGSAAAVSRASIADLKQVEGIDEGVAKAIHDHFREK